MGVGRWGGGWVRTAALGAVAALALGGCATCRSLPLLYRSGTPKLYLGTRVDLAALRERPGALEPFLDRHGIRPPEHPLADLPLSFLLDTALLPVTAPVALYEVIAE